MSCKRVVEIKYARATSSVVVTVDRVVNNLTALIFDGLALHFEFLLFHRVEEVSEELSMSSNGILGSGTIYPWLGAVGKNYWCGKTSVAAGN